VGASNNIEMIAAQTSGQADRQVISPRFSKNADSCGSCGLQADAPPRVT